MTETPHKPELSEKELSEMRRLAALGATVEKDVLDETAVQCIKHSEIVLGCAPCLDELINHFRKLKYSRRKLRHCVLEIAKALDQYLGI